MTPDDLDDARRLVHLEQRAAMALAGIQAAMLLNGGAAVAILALIGSLAGAPSASIVDVSPFSTVGATLVATAAEEDRPRMTSLLTRWGMSTVVAGPEGLLAVATHPDVDIVICASAGTAGLEAVLAAIAAANVSG